jgi:hypothetical protein
VTEMEWNDVPDELRKYVAGPGSGPTRIVEPLYVPWESFHALAPWHPQDIGRKDYSFKHVACRDEHDKPVVQVVEITGDWDGGMKDALTQLRLYLQPAANGMPEHLAHTTPIEFDDWKITRWVVTLTSSLFDGGKLHQDIITWQDSVGGPEEGAQSISVMSWLPYPD